jgi:hypothetical protein
MPEPASMKLGMHTMAPEPISTAYFLKPSQQSVCLCVYHSIVARQRLGKNVTETTNAYAKMEEFLDASLSMRLVSYQRKLGGQFFPELPVILFRNTISVMIGFFFGK